MEYPKTPLFKMSQGSDCLASPQASPQSAAAGSEATSALAGATSTSFKIGQAVTNFFLQPSNATSAPVAAALDPYSTYADNFDLSLLPQDCTSPDEDNNNNNNNNIPTTIYQYNSNNNNNNAQTPQIKIELAWPSSSSGPLANDVKSETTSSLHYEQVQHQQHQLQVPTKSPHQLIPPPPPPYPYAAYPSPQSSPAQSEYGFPHSHGFASSYESLSSSRSSLYHPASPCPSLSDASVASSLVARIKQELHILPPSPPESSCETPSPQSVATPFDIKSELFETDAEALVDLNALIEKEVGVGSSVTKLETPSESGHHQDHQLLREYLEDTTFQKRHNLKPLALESFFGGLEEVRGDIEPVISLALEHAKREADETCAKLQISQDPSAWSPLQVHAWLRSTTAQFELPPIDNLEAKFCENGAALILLTEEEFVRRSPESGSTLHAQLEIWKMAFSDCYQMSSPTTNGFAQMETTWRPSQYTLDMPMDGDEVDSDVDDDIAATAGNSNVPVATVTATTDTKRPATGRTGGSHIHLWQFLKELLSQPHLNGTAIRWMDRGKGVFKIEDSVRVAKLWGKRKNRPAMNYDKLSRSIRQYYKKGIMKKTERSQRLVYQFCHPYHL